MDHRNRLDINEMTGRLALPSVFPSSFVRVPVMFVPDAVVLGSDMLAIGGATWYEFGVLSSVYHFRWMQMVTGESDGVFHYTPERVYNTFAWPERNEESTATITNAAKAVAAAREAIEGFTFARDYADMPEALLSAHRNLDRAVARAYGLPEDATIDSVMSEIFRRYEILSGNPVRRSGDRHGGDRRSGFRLCEDGGA